MITSIVSIADMLVASSNFASSNANTLVEVTKILVVSTLWIGGLIIWVKNKESHKNVAS